MSDTLIERAKAYISAVESGANANELERFYSRDIISEELPNRLVPNGDVRDFAKLRVVNEHGRGMFARQSYTVANAVVQGDQVLLETTWSAVLQVPLGRLEAGREMRARSAQIFEFRDGLIRRHRSYDSFDW